MTLLVDQVKRNPYAVSTRTAATEAKYMENMYGYIRTYLRKQGLDVTQKRMLKGVSAALIIMSIVDRKDRLAQATWRQYKAWLMYFYSVVLQERELKIKHPNPLKTHPQESIEELRLVLVYLSELEGPAPDKGRVVPKGNTLRKKDISTKLLNKVILYLQAQAQQKTLSGQPSYPYAQLTATWLSVGSITGLRPAEWNHAEIVTEAYGRQGLFLRVKNCKSTNNRANGSYRHLDLEDLSQAEVSLITQFVDLMSGLSPERFKKLTTHCKTTLNRVNRQIELGLLHKRVSIADEKPTRRRGSGIYKATRERDFLRIHLYSARHKFSSEAKQHYSQQEVAALMGHATDATATVHYGKRRSGSAGLKIKPVPEEVASVRVMGKSHANSATRTYGKNLYKEQKSNINAAGQVQINPVAVPADTAGNTVTKNVPAANVPTTNAITQATPAVASNVAESPTPEPENPFNFNNF